MFIEPETILCLKNNNINAIPIPKTSFIIYIIHIPMYFIVQSHANGTVYDDIMFLNKVSDMVIRFL